ncbi:ATP-binding protein [Tenacibaculum pacificus]|uniref:ATP-binding protein n=1 Tax=Tenacibaculum TaxID=104267 RepID=UPI0022F3FE07|nr:ATP-binding protein [Tenacibaculum pacificus]WBX72924.1 ATP-binding protein [Tenacibaculum pacificus]
MAKKAYNVKQLLSKKFDLLDFEGKWQTSFGQPCRQFSMIIMGPSGSGKTELAIQLSKYLTNFGKVAYNSIEQGFSHTLQMAMERNNMEQVANKFTILDKEQLPELTDRLRKQRSPDFVIIDSLQYLRATKQEYFDFKNEFYPKKGIIFISHQDGNEAKGALAKDVWYDVDIQVPVEGFRGVPKKRLNGGGVPYIVNAERAAVYHGKIK